MGDSHDAAAALRNNPRWVAVHENLLARLGAILAMATQGVRISELDYESLIQELDAARSMASWARGVDLDVADKCAHFWIERDGTEWCALCQGAR